MSTSSLQSIEEKIEASSANDDNRDSRIKLLQEVDILDTFESFDLFQKARVKWDIEEFPPFAKSSGLCALYRDTLETPASLDEVKNAVWDCGSSKDLSPDRMDSVHSDKDISGESDQTDKMRHAMDDNGSPQKKIYERHRDAYSTKHKYYPSTCPFKAQATTPISSKSEYSTALPASALCSTSSDDLIVLHREGYDVKIIDILALLEDEEKFSKVNDEDAIRVCLLLSLEVIFMGKELVLVVDDVFLRMVNNLDAWNSFPWGKHIWRQLYDSIRNVSSKHKLEYLAGLRKNPNHVPSYSLTGFLFAFKAPIELAPTKAELQSKWYTPSNDYFMWYAPRSPPVSIGGLYGEYLNKRLATRAAKKKSSKEFHHGLCGREKHQEAALIDRVRDLEGICESLLTLPKAVKSLRGRIFKLESIIQVSLYPTCGVEKEETLKKVGLL
ncbi:hypothetical protein Tco_1329668 [Tanacetum coccineum]